MLSPLGNVFNVSFRESFLFKWCELFLKKRIIALSSKSTEKFVLFCSLLGLNYTDFLTSFTFMHLIHSGWFFRMAFIPTVLRRWCSPVQWWAETGIELPGASLMLYFEVCIIFLWHFPSVGPASGPKSWERGGTALWVLCLPTGPKDYRRSFPPLEYTTNGACF